MMPALGKVKQQANLIICKSRLHQWTLVFKLYTDDYGGLFPKDCSIEQGYITLTQPYLKDERLRLCPTATKTPPEGGQQLFAAWDEDEFKGSYGLNDWVLSGWPGISSEQDRWLWKTPNVVGATQVPLILDCSIFTYVNPRHQEMTNGAFLDFCVRRVGLKELWEIRWHRNWPMDAPPPDWPEWMEHMRDYAE